MAVVVSARYTTQAVTGKHAVIEGRAVVLTSTYAIGDLPGVEYPDGINPTHVWVAIMPPDNFPLPTPHDLFTAPPTRTYRVTDPAIYTDPILTGEDWLIPHSAIIAPVIHHYEKVALVRGVVGITPECYQDGADTETPGTLLAINPNGLFRKSDKNHPIVVAQTVYYAHSTGMLYINVF
jgi:hypothetical protein